MFDALNGGPARRRSPGRLLEAVVLFIATSAAFTACGEGGTTEPQHGSEIEQYVAGEAASNLGAGAMFTLAGTPSDPAGEVDEQLARQLAEAFAMQFGPLGRPVYEQQHGAPIAFEQLRPCGRSYYARSSYAPISPTVDPARRYAFGSWWIVGMCSAGSRPQLAVAVSALATSLRVNSGQIVFPAIYGEEFVATGVPSDWSGALPSSPEDAVLMLARRSGRRVFSVPELIAPSLLDGGPFASFWRMQVDAPIQLHGSESGSQARTSDVYVGLLGGWRQDRRAMSRRPDVQLPMADQPAVAEFTGRDMAALNAMLGKPYTGPTAPVAGRAERRPGTPIRFENVTIAAAGDPR